ncbi:hypothetical protein [Hyphomicrobium sp. CS1GBMeth3]|uniref:hypothetical protein n=1 Tax=Hyphomicrobium sp. CS1GBMeth3 TaxID=1892845 RepID=UPI001114BC25|nr:hypothetical protein [Hyphomicrobium sp. CS1GBMeth3]
MNGRTTCALVIKAAMRIRPTPSASVFGTGREQLDLKRSKGLFGIEFEPTVGNNLMESCLKVGLRQTRKLALQCCQKAGILMA